MLFADVIGQDAAKAHLLGMWQQNHLPHALLICGPEGTGGLPLALALAQFVLCEHKTNHDACGHCPNCHKIAKLEHADVHFSFPSIKPDKKKEVLSDYYIKEFRKFILDQPYDTLYNWLQYIQAENKQGNISADECRAIIEKLNLKAYEGGKKVMIIWRPEFLGKEGNMLLKLIEEPPIDTLIVLVAESIEEILPTIMSRVQQIKLPPIKASDLAQALIYKGANEKRAQQVANIAEGSFIAALRLLTEEENDLFPQARNWFNLLFTNNGVGLAKFADELSKTGREQQKNFLHYVIHLLETTLKQRFTHHCNLSDEESTFVQKLAATHLSFETINTMIDEIGKTSYYIQRNASGKIQVHALCIKLMSAIQNKKLSSLVQ